MDNLEYKCPCCGGAIAFDANSQKLKCPYCDTEFEPDALKAYDEDLKTDGENSEEWNDTAGSQWQDGEKDSVIVYTCESCGGEIIGDKNTAATACPYCGNPQIIKSQLAGALKPDFVIPFKKDKKAAIEAYKKHIKGKKLLPKIFRDENHIDEIKGIYVPFWLFDADVNANMRYKASTVRVWTDSRYEYTETCFFSVLRGGNLSFRNVPADGSRRMADDLMESVEPFDFSEAVDFQTAYLSGFFADKYDVSSDESIERANKRIRTSTEDEFRNTVQGYATVSTESSTVNVANGKTKYALYPIWLLHTTYKDQKFVFAMNGQTGKFVGDLPLDKGLYARWLFSLTGILSAVIFIIALLVWFL